MNTSNDVKMRCLYGVNPVLEALLSSTVVHEVFVQKGKKRVKKRLERVLASRESSAEIKECSAQELQRICRSAEHQGIAARAEPLKNGSLSALAKERKRLFVMLIDGVEDPRNLGAIYRVADAVGVNLVFLPSRGSASHQLPSVAKASAGAVEHVPTVRTSKLKKAVGELRELDFRVYALEGKKEGRSPGDVESSERLALIVGSEGRGVSTTLAEMADAYISIPMYGKVNSLNVASATAIAVYSLIGLM